MTNQDLWVGYFELGGNGSLVQIAGWLAGEVELPPGDHDMLALALNEAFSDRGLDHPVGYSEESMARAAQIGDRRAGRPGGQPPPAP